MKKLAYLLLGLTFVLASCSKDKEEPPVEPTLAISSENACVQVGADGKTATADLPTEGATFEIAVATNQATWSAEAENDPGWIHLTKGTGKLTVTVDPNTTTELMTGKVVVKAGAGSGPTATIGISQSGVAKATLSLDPRTFPLASGGGSQIVAIESNQSEIDWKGKPEWLTVEKNEQTLVFSAAANKTGGVLSAEVVVVAGTGGNTAADTVRVTQEPKIQALVYTVKTTVAATAVSLPALKTSDAEISFAIDYGDGETETKTESLTTAMKHTYAEAGTYTVTITSENAVSSVSFASNTRVTSVTANGQDWSAVKNLSKAFYNCSALASVSSELFETCAEATDASQLFYGCKALTIVPAGLFDNLAKVTTFSGCFQNTGALATIPNDLFKKCASVKNFSRVFASSGVPVIPSGFFSACPEADSFDYAFNNCASLVSIGEQAFKGCVKVTSFFAAFSDCSKLEALPADMFADCPLLNDLNYTFQSTGLKAIPAGLFDNCRKITGMDYCFQRCTGLTGETPYTMVGDKKVHLYERGAYPDEFTAPMSYSSCFAYDTGLSDFDAMSRDYPDWVEE